MICNRLELCVEEVLSGKHPEKCGNHSEEKIYPRKQHEKPGYFFQDGWGNYRGGFISAG